MSPGIVRAISARLWDRAPERSRGGKAAGADETRAVTPPDGNIGKASFSARAGGTLVTSGIASGATLAVLAIVLDALAHGGFAVQGVSVDAGAQLAASQYLRSTLVAIARSLAGYVAIFVAVGVIARVLHSFARGARKLTALRMYLETIAAGVVLHALVLLAGAIRRPQLYEGTFRRLGLYPVLDAFATAAGHTALIVIGCALIAAWLFIAHRSSDLRGLLRGGDPRRPALALSVALLAVWLLAFSPGSSAPISSSSASAGGGIRHVVLVGIDSLRTDRLYPEGGAGSPMPYLSKLIAERGSGFTTTYVPLARTFPSWVSILTSQYPQAHGVQTMFPRKAEREKVPPTLPSVLRKAGFHTSVCSDFAGDIFPRYRFGFDAVHAPTLNFHTLIDSAAIEAGTQLLPYLDNTRGRRAFPALRALAHAPDAAGITDDCVRELHAHASGKTFSLLFYSDAHFPYAAPFPGYDRFRQPGYSGENRFQFSAATILKSETSEQDVLQARGLYDAGLWTVDRQIERLVSELRDSGQLGSTLLVVTADHGENLGEHGMGFAHGNHLLGVASHAVPFVWVDFSKPARARPVDHERQVSALDIAPTLLGLAGVAPATSFTGRDLLASSGDSPVLLQSGIWFADRERSKEMHQAMRIPYPGVDRTTFANPENNDEIELSDRYARTVYFAKHLGYQAGADRVVYMPLRPRPRWQLFDTKADPWTQRDLAPEQPDRLAALRGRMLAEMRAVAPLEESNGYLYWGAAIPADQPGHEDHAHEHGDKRIDSDAATDEHGHPAGGAGLQPAPGSP